MNRKIDNLKATLSSIKGQIADSSTELTSLYRQIEEQKSSIALLEEKQKELSLDRLRFDKYVSEKTKSLSAYEGELRDREEKIEWEIKEKDDIVLVLESKISSHNDCIKDLDILIASKTRKVDDIKKELSDMDDKVDEYNKLKNDIVELEKVIKNLYEGHIRDISAFDIQRKDMLVNLSELKQAEIDIMRSIGAETKTLNNKKENTLKVNKELETKRRDLMILAKRIEDYHKERNPNFKINVI
jgi:chromosome segregation ATPase